MNDAPLVGRALAVLRAQDAPEPNPLFVDRVIANALAGAAPSSEQEPDWLLGVFGLAWRGAVLSAVAATVTLVGLATNTPSNVGAGSLGEVRSSLVTDQPWIGADAMYSALLPVAPAAISDEDPDQSELAGP